MSSWSSGDTGLDFGCLGTKLMAANATRPFLTAAEIVFSDLSSVRWDGVTFARSFLYGPRSEGETEADRFIANRDAIARNAAGLTD
jgi:hypothetical protein